MIQTKDVKSNTVDKIFEDLLEDDFVNVFKPIFIIQQVLGMLGVNIEYKFITPPNRWFKVYSCIIWIINSLCIIYSVIYCRTLFDSLSTDIPLKMGLILNGVVYTSLAWCSVFYSGYCNSQLYVKLQRIERSLKMKNAKQINRTVYIMSLLSVVNSVVLTVVWIIMFNKYVMSDYCPTGVFSSGLGSASYYEIYHIFIILYFILLRVEYINEMLEPGKTEVKAFSNPFASEQSDKIGDELVNGMYHILESYADTMDIYQHAILIYTFQMLAWQLISMQKLVVSFKDQMSVNIPSFLCTLTSSLVYMGLMLLLCFISQSLTSKFEKCGELCINLLSSLDEGKSRHNAKRILLLLKGKRDATVFDIFTLNTGLPFHLLAITASYTIVLLQFAVL